jgi:gliding motility-associated-like protein
LRCAPSLVQFTDLSTADSPINYAWDFGDGNISSEQNPSHLYSNMGDYTVSLTIETTSGCVDTLTMTYPAPIEIQPSPVSNFTLTPNQTDICHADIAFFDQSVGADSILYWHDDGSSSSNAVYTYTSSGWFRPMQIAINEFGCRDTSYQQLYIEPFLIYIPNSFTPDGDNFNNEFNPVHSLDVIGWKLKLYNRWGELVFESQDPTIGWNGTYKGLIAQDGLYTYQLNYQSCENPIEWHTLNGFVSLLK